MAQTGTLHSWNDDRGFGFIRPTGGGPEIFVHISAFPRNGSRPSIGENLTFELGSGRDGKFQAIKVVRQTVTQNAQARTTPHRHGKRKNWLGVLLLILILGIAGAYGYKHFAQAQNRRALATQPATSTAEVATLPSHGAFSCDGRIHCSEMTSCSEAKWFINNCPGTEMDGNHDGTPCEQQWCTSPFAK